MTFAPMKLTAGINGFGRFGLHLLRYWLDRREKASFALTAINDSALSLKDALGILCNDPYVRFDDCQVDDDGSHLILVTSDHRATRILYSTGAAEAAPWLGATDLFFETSGQYVAADDCRAFLREKTRQILISATSEKADQTLIYGFNHDDWTPCRRIVSYGSCTVNAYVPLAAWIHDQYGVVDSDVNVIHNSPQHRMRHTLHRSNCTLERSGPSLLEFLKPQKFAVNYTIVPYSGVSIIDFRFRTHRPVSQNVFLRDLRLALEAGPLESLYAIEQTDTGPEPHVCTPYNAVFIANRIRARGDNLYLQAYLDTENSANRFFDLADYVSRRFLAEFKWESGAQASAENVY